MKLFDVGDYIIIKVKEAGESLNLLKLQKLLYYSQAWHLAFYGTVLFEGKFQAWVHGPVNREIYDRYFGSKSLYSEMTENDVGSGFDIGRISRRNARHIDTVLEAYAGLTSTQLEEMTHREEPWRAARGDRRPSERCAELIDESLMKRYYASRLKHDD